MMLSALILAAALASVHDEKLSVSKVEVGKDEVVWTVDVALQGLEKVLRLPAEPLDLSERQLQSSKDDIVRYLRTCMKIGINGALVEPEVGPLEPVYETFVASGEKYIAHARQQFRFRSKDAVKRS